MDLLRTQENIVFALLKNSLEDTLNSHNLGCLNSLKWSSIYRCVIDIWASTIAEQKPMRKAAILSGKSWQKEYEFSFFKFAITWR